ncbi:DUF4845 domain-containing protein [Thioalkalivibrio sp. ALJ24]|uniref:DUF4845 domain-containing protein n=1 Tax=Thioalkalivibrio sp. ALJ24 TaxID=545276 RepID=UPI00036BECE3|nr:DUF4845 domain-containing protein [Thioalkalivibrio sp. ALJ24]
MRGAGATTIMAMIFLALLVLTFLIQMGTQYTQYLTVRSILQDVAEQPGSADKSEDELWGDVSRRFRLNTVPDEIGEEHFSVRDGDDGPEMNIDYEVRRGFLGNIDIVAQFSYSATLQD